MPKLIGSPTLIPAVGNVTKFVQEFVGVVNTGESKYSISLVKSPSGWIGSGQYSDYHEYRLVLSGVLHVEHGGGETDIEHDQGLDIGPGEWVRYSTPGPEGATYVTFCVPAFSRAGVHRDA